MPLFKVPCNWEVYGVMSIEAPNLEEATRKAEEEEIPYPTIDDNIEGSLEVNYGLVELLNPGKKLEEEPPLEKGG